MTKIIVGIPCYNSEDTVKGVIDRVKKQKVDQIIVVNDKSTDNSLKILKKIKGIKIVEHKKNKGLGGVTKTLFDELKKTQGVDNWLILVHSDGQILPEEIPKFRKKIDEKKWDVIFGSRNLGKQEDLPFLKRYGDPLITGVQNWAYGLKMSTYASGFRAFSKKGIKKINYKPLDDRHSFDSEIIVTCANAGLRICEIPVTPVYDDEVSNYNMIEYVFKIMIKSVKYKFGNKKF